MSKRGIGIEEEILEEEKRYTILYIVKLNNILKTFTSNENIAQHGMLNFENIAPPGLNILQTFTSENIGLLNIVVYNLLNSPFNKIFQYFFNSI